MTYWQNLPIATLSCSQSVVYRCVLGGIPHNFRSLDSPSEKTSSSTVEADGRLHNSSSESCSSRVSRCRLLLIQARRLTVDDGLSITSIHREL